MRTKPRKRTRYEDDNCSPSETDLTTEMSGTEATESRTNVSIFRPPVVTVAVGPDKTKYVVHKQVLARAEAGEFFNKAFTNGFKEQHTECLELPEDDPDTFESFIEWLYRVCVGSAAPNELTSGRDAPRLLRSYIFAHKYMIKNLQDAIISKMFDSMKKSHWRDMGFDRDMLERFLATVPNSHMHKLLARCFMDQALNATMSHARDVPDSVMGSLPHDFVHMVTREMFNVRLARIGTYASVARYSGLGDKNEYLHSHRE